MLDSKVYKHYNLIQDESKSSTRFEQLFAKSLICLPED